MKAKKASVLKYILIAFTIALSLNASAQLKANFTSNITKGCSPIVVHFKDSSSGNPNYWKWDLGNGTISYLKNPSVSYINPGLYSVKLVVKNATQQDSIVKQQFITVYDLPNVEFTADNRGGCYPLKSQFSDLSTASGTNITEWLWDFGDGNTATTQNPLYTYNSEGSFNVKLKVTTAQGCFKVIGKNNYINVQGGVKANFTFTSTGTCAPPTPVNFTNTSTGSSALTYQWSFGDGNFSTANNPTNNYTTNGSYSVTLIAMNAVGCTDTIKKANLINIGTVKANFTLPQTTICAGTPLTINNTSSPATVFSNWSFGDGAISSNINPTKTYTTAGTYSIKLVNNFGACTDSITKQITVLAKPQASFTAVNHIGCTSPLNVQFINNSTGGVTYFWEFGNGNNSNLQNPTFTYLTNGDYTITLAVTGANGCTDTSRINNYVSIKPPKILSIEAIPNEGCIPLPVSFKAAINSPQNITSYNWSFGDGGTSSDSTPIHTYTSDGTYSIKLTITTSGGCIDTLTLVDGVKAGKKPHANFDASPRISCPDNPVYFNDLSTNGPIDKWKWIFGDGNNSDIQNPSNNYRDTGFMSIKLIVWNKGCSDTLVKGNYVYINPPIAKFELKTECTNRLKVAFIDSSIMPISYHWDFGDGTTSTAANPVHTYNTGGLYNVVLTVTNGPCSSKALHIAKVDNKVGIFNIENNITCRNDIVTYRVDSLSAINPPSSFDWYFTANTLYHYHNNLFSTRFYNPGHYPASVVINYENGCKDSLVSNTGVTIYGPLANFNSLTNQFCKQSLINFSDSSITDGIHPIQKWIWNYGDGHKDTSFNAPFAHTYTSGGRFDIQLKVVDSYGCEDSIYKANAVLVSSLKSDFSVTDTLICPSTPITFSNLCIANSNTLSFSWNFGDGTTSTDASIFNHIYANQGTYNVQLIAKDEIGCTDTLVKQIQVYNPTAGFLMSDSTAVCPPLLVNFTNQSLHSGSYKWNFGDNSHSVNQDVNHLYTYPGNYEVKLLVTNTGGCADSVTKVVKIYGPTGTLSYNPIIGCVPLQVTFNATTNNTVKNTWDYDNGTTNTSTSNTANYTFTSYGEYLPKLILEDAQGCKVAVKGIDTIKVKYVTAQFNTPTHAFCDSALAYFSGNSSTNDIIVNHVWSFGDGATYTGDSLSNHLYNNVGNYSVKMKVTTQTGCTDSITVTDAIRIVSSPKTIIKGDTAVCKNEFLQFTAGLLNNDTSAIKWYWNFGNGDTSNLQTPQPVLYTSNGTFILINKATNSLGCETITKQNITVHALPVVQVSPDTTICRNQSVTLNATGANSYMWFGNTSTLNCSSCSTVIAKPLTNITYVVKGINGYNCEASDTVNVIVKQPGKLDVIKGDTLCLGESINIKASGTELYTWYPSIYIDNSNTNNVTIHPTKDTTIKYTLIGKDDKNCFSDTAYVSIKTYPIPKFNILQTELTVNAGSQVSLETSNSSDITKWKWYPTRFLDNATKTNPVMTAKEDITYMCVASNDGNCIAKDEIKVIVICNGGNVFLPNTFSPNGDGSNDVFYPRGKGIYGIKSLRIFNRWGEMVFERTNFMANDASAGWDGTYKGQKLHSDAYVYTVELMCDNNTTIPAKGSITLLR